MALSTGPAGGFKSSPLLRSWVLPSSENCSFKYSAGTLFRSALMISFRVISSTLFRAARSDIIDLSDLEKLTKDQFSAPVPVEECSGCLFPTEVDYRAEELSSLRQLLHF